MIVEPSGNAQQACRDLYSYRNYESGLKEKLTAEEITNEFFLVTDPEAATWRRQTILSELDKLVKNGENNALNLLRRAADNIWNTALQPVKKRT